jgi:hypothetical protein
MLKNDRLDSDPVRLTSTDWHDWHDLFHKVENPMPY